MKKGSLLFGFVLIMGTSTLAQSQRAMLYSNNPQLAANKKIVYDFWRSVLEGGHLDLAPQYMLETYIQHNPNAVTGRQGFIDFFKQFTKPQPIADTIKAPLIAITAEGNLVTLSFKQTLPDPKDATKKYVTTWFDMLRTENGKLAEHWDCALKQ